jgi:hypothetical protein
MDIAPEVVLLAHRRYGRPNARFLASSCSAIPIMDESVERRRELRNP